MLKIACIGEAMVELSLDQDGNSAQVSIAGDTLNVAIYMRRELPHDHDVAFVSVLGTDPLSTRILDFIETEGVSTAAITRTADRLPGLYSINTDDNGERSFSYWRENSAARLLFQNNAEGCFDILDSFDLVYLSAITLAVLTPDVRESLFNWIGAYRARGGQFAFDSNYRPVLWADKSEAQHAVARAWSLADIALPSLDDEMPLFDDPDEGSVLRRLRGYGIKVGALKRGNLGPVPIAETVELVPTFAAAEHVVDTTAAGDSFNGAFIATYLTSGNLMKALTAGHNCASKVIGHKGAIMPKSGVKPVFHKQPNNA